MEREATFKSLGTTISALNVRDALTQGNLNYNVKKESIYLSDGTIIDGQKATIRDTDKHIYGIVSDKYQVIQNEDSFGFIDYMSDQVKLEKVGETQSGMVYLIGSLDKINILDDEYQPYIIFRNSHNGKYQLQATICPLRIVCQNQFNMAFKESPNTITIRHSSKAEGKLKEAFIILKNTANYLKMFNQQAEKWANIKISDVEAIKLLNDLFPMEQEMKDFQKERINEQRKLLQKAFYSDDNRNFKNSMWGMINAYSDYITHKTPIRKTNTAQENQFISISFDPTIMQRFINMIQSRIAY